MSSLSWNFDIFLFKSLIITASSPKLFAVINAPMMRKIQQNASYIRWEIKVKLDILLVGMFLDLLHFLSALKQHDRRKNNILKELILQKTQFPQLNSHREVSNPIQNLYNVIYNF